MELRHHGTPPPASTPEAMCVHPVDAAELFERDDSSEWSAVHSPLVSPRVADEAVAVRSAPCSHVVATHRYMTTASYQLCGATSPGFGDARSGTAADFSSEGFASELVAPDGSRVRDHAGHGFAEWDAASVRGTHDKPFQGEGEDSSHRVAPTGQTMPLFYRMPVARTSAQGRRKHKHRVNAQGKRVGRARQAVERNIIEVRYGNSV